MRKETVLFALLRAAVCGQPVSEDIQAACTAPMLESVYDLSNSHDLAHLAGQALTKLDLPESQALSRFQLATKQAVFRYMRLDLACEQAYDALEKAQIPFVPLKGAILRDYYPEPWMRTSCDVDILVREMQLDAAVNALESRQQFTEERRTDHDVSMYSPTGVHLELHFATVVESDNVGKSSNVLSGIWDAATPCKPGTYRYQLTAGMFYFYHIAHMAKHFAGGGCGIRPFLDLWVLNHRADSDLTQYTQLLEQGGMLAFARAAEKLAEVWFSNDTGDTMTAQVEQYILEGGVYGTEENDIALQQIKQGGKFRYALSKIFPSYDIIKFHYPVLQKHKWLTPVFQVVRWFKLLFKGGVKRSVRKLRRNASTSREGMQSAEALLEYLGIK